MEARESLMEARESLMEAKEHFINAIVGGFENLEQSKWLLAAIPLAVVIPPLAITLTVIVGLKVFVPVTRELFNFSGMYSLILCFKQINLHIIHMSIFK